MLSHRSRTRWPRSFKPLLEALENRIVPAARTAVELPLDGDEPFADNLPRAVLGREPRAEETSFWTRQIRAGLPRAEAAGYFLHSQEFAGQVVNSTYLSLLHRPPDAAGDAFWIAGLMDGLRGDRFAVALLTSNEYRTLHGSEPAPWLTAVYSDLFARTPDGLGLTFWTNLLHQGVEKATVAAALLASPEADRLAIQSGYLAFLGRAPEAGGLAFWQGVLDSGTSHGQLAAALASTPEFVTRLSTGVVSPSSFGLFGLTAWGDGRPMAPLPASGRDGEGDSDQPVLPGEFPGGLAPTFEYPGDLYGAGDLASFAPGSLGVQPSAFSSRPVRYFDGVVKLAFTDLQSQGFGTAWGVTRSWSNADDISATLYGNDMVVTQLPYVVEDLSGSVTEVANGYARRYFDPSGANFVERYFAQDTLVRDTGNTEFVLTDPTGAQLRFEDAGSGVFSRFKSFTDRGGNVTIVDDYDPTSGGPTEVLRSNTTGGTTITESYLYDYVDFPDVNSGKVEKVTLRRKVDSGSWTTVRSAEYTYHGSGASYGNFGDLKLSVVKDGSGNGLDTTYTRYYTSSSSTGYVGALKYVFRPASYARLVAALGSSVDSLSDSQVAPYADHYFEYDSSQRVTKETVQGDGCSSCSGGLGTYTYSYTTSSNSDGLNSWKVKTVETLPDSNTNTVYTNAAGQVMLFVYHDVTANADWIRFSKYDDEGRVSLAAEPSAVSGYDDTKADLLNSQSGNYQYLRDSSGLLRVWEFATSTTATTTTAGDVDGYEKAAKVRQGETGSNITVTAQQYIARNASSATVYPVASTTAYANTDSTGARVTNYTLKTSEPGGLVTKQTVDGAGRVTTTYQTDGSGDTSWSDADDVSSDLVLEQLETTHDSAGNALLTTTRRRFHDETAAGALGNATTSPKARVSYQAAYYDKSNRIVATVDVGTNGGASYTRPSTVPSRSDTVLVTETAYNAAGWVETTTDPRAIPGKRYYDNLGRVTKTIEAYADGTPSNTDDKTTEFTYDGMNHMLSLKALMTSGAYQETAWVYGVTTSTSSAVNSNDLLANSKWPDKSSGAASNSEKETYTVNALGERITAQDRNGNVHTFSFDILGRMTSDAVTTLGSGVDGAVRRRETAYDGQGNAYQFTTYDASSSGNVVNQVQRAFNVLGQLITEYQEHTGSVNTSTSVKVQYTYSELANGANHSRLLTLVYPNGKVLTHNYTTGLDSSISRLSSLSDTSGTLESYSYLGLDTFVIRAHSQPGVDLTYVKQSGESNGDAGDQYTGLDRHDRIVDQRWIVTSDGSHTDRFLYGYDRNGNRLYRTNELNHSFDELYHANGSTAGYDSLNQLTEFRRGTLTDSNSDGVPDTVTTASRSLGWSFDPLGNWSNLTTDGTGEAQTHNKQNQATGVGSATLTFDANGNMTTDETGKQYEYDAWNHLLKVKSSGGATLTSYQVDERDRRIVENPGTTRDLYYSSAWQVLEERVGGTAQMQYVGSPTYVDGLILRDRDADANSNNGLEERLWVQQDANYNVTALVAGSGTVGERYAYDPYGAVMVLSSAWGSLSGSVYAWIYLHQGGRLDATTGLYPFRHRDLSPALGRWTEVDPSGFRAGDANFYQYESNSVITRLDPSGLEWSWSAAGSGAAVGAAVGCGVGAAVGVWFLVIGALPGCAFGAVAGGVIGAVAGGFGGKPTASWWLGKPQAQVTEGEAAIAGAVIGIPAGVVGGIIGPIIGAWATGTGIFAPKPLPPPAPPSPPPRYYDNNTGRRLDDAPTVNIGRGDTVIIPPP